MTQPNTLPPEPSGSETASSGVPDRERRVVLHMPVNVRSFSLGLLALLASIYTLHWAGAVFIPILVGILSSYMLLQLFTSALVGGVTWLYFLAMGLDHTAVWGVAAGVLNLVPYLGSVVVAAGSAMVAFLQFGSLQTVLLVGGGSLVIHAIIGFLLTPWLTSRANQMNPVAVFVGMLAWGWLWGLWGLLLGGADLGRRQGGVRPYRRP